MDKKSILQTFKSKQIKDMLKEKHVIGISLFGSFARGDEKNNSDIDLLVEYDKDSNVTIFDVLELQEKLQKEFSNNSVDIITPKKKDKRFFSVINDDLIKII